MKLLFSTALGLTAVLAATDVRAEDGAALYKESCAQCHDAGVDRAPSREALRGMSPQRILDALEAWFKQFHHLRAKREASIAEEPS